jgi:hypothetical protein
VRSNDYSHRTVCIAHLEREALGASNSSFSRQSKPLTWTTCRLRCRAHLQLYFDVLSARQSVRGWQRCQAFANVVTKSNSGTVHDANG